MMALSLSRILAQSTLAAVILVFFLTPAHACLWMGGWLDPDKPFSEAYLDEGQIIIHGRPKGIYSPKLDTKTTRGSGPEVDFENGYEVTFEVLTTYRGEKRESWTAYQIGSPFRESLDLETFKKEVGDDLLVVLSKPDDFSKQFTQLPIIALGTCGELAMRSFAVMEPVLRQRGFID
jgi:hypothetical protein